MIGHDNDGEDWIGRYSDGSIIKSARVHDSAYMGFIAKLQCPACLYAGIWNTEVQVAHLRAGSLEHGKRPTGMQEKPSDRWTLPLCMPHHTGDRRSAKISQHSMSETEFWKSFGIDPFQLCIDLGAAFDRKSPGRGVISQAVAAGKKKVLGT